jgi:hypothetical protein
VERPQLATALGTDHVLHLSRLVREATRLTRAGQLVEATALLQRMLQGGSAPAPTSRSDAQAPLARLEPPTIDAKAEVVWDLS